MAEAKTADAMGASEAKTATAQTIADDKTSTAKAPTVTPTPLPTNTPTPSGSRIIRPILPVGKLIDLSKLRIIAPDWKDNFASSPLDGWYVNPAGVVSLDGANLVMTYGANDAWFIQNTVAKDFTYVGKLTLVSGRMMGLVFRSSLDGTMGYEVNLDAPSRTLSIAKRTPWEVLASTTLDVAYNTAYTVRVEFIGTNITASIDDLGISVTTTDTSYSQGYFGLHTYQSQARFSDLSMYWR